jgi:hypothetical protein
MAPISTEPTAISDAPAPAPETNEPAVATTPVKAPPAVKAKKLITLLIGLRGKAKQQSHFLHAHESVLDILKKNGQQTDGSLIALKPGTKEPFEMSDVPYDEVSEGAKVEVVPNQPDQF